jgi:hypothetical protein
VVEVKAPVRLDIRCDLAHFLDSFFESKTRFLLKIACKTTCLGSTAARARRDDMSAYRPLSPAEIQTLETKGNTAEDWSLVQVGEGFDPLRVQNTHFAGKIRIGSLQGSVSVEGGVELPACILDATLVNCELGDDVRIARIGSHLANYVVETGACIVDVGTMATRPGATFGNGVEAETVNEGGGREVTLFDEISSQFAYLLAMHRHNPELIAQLQAMVAARVAAVTSDTGRVSRGAVISHVGEIIDVNVGPAAVISGAQRLRNGTILSEEVAPTRVGAGVVAEDFIIAEGATVADGVVLLASFAGQGVQLGKQFSAENSLFFANCEGFHGEACSVFAGPYTVTHHKSTLLIAGIYSFYNAGSGTNQSNHMYKLGPVHQGVLQRGSKNGSFSYMRWPTVVGPFCVIIGKHLNNFDIGDLPFSYVTEESGQSLLTPAMNMYTVGTVRDGNKWPDRDRRTASVKRDQIVFEVYSPYTVQKMIKGEAVLTSLHEATPREVEQIRYNGVTIRRLMLRRSARNYADGIDTYLRREILDRVAAARTKGAEAIRAAVADTGVYSAEWSDLGGLLIGRERLRKLEADIVDGSISTVDEVLAAFEDVRCNGFEQDKWSWVRHTYETRTGRCVDDLSADDFGELDRAQAKSNASFVKRVLADAEKEFNEVAMLGYGADGNAEERAADFDAVRGSFADNSFVKQIQEMVGD